MVDFFTTSQDDIVNEARLSPTLALAVTDCHVTIATTSTRGRDLEPDLDPRGVAERFRSLSPDQTLAIVFGREDRGLTADETSQCHRTAAIPTSPEFPTMNLAQSVSIFCYELARQGKATSASRDLAVAAEVERLHERLQALLVEAGFLHSGNPDHIYDELRSLAGRLELDRREVTLLLGMIRQLEWRMRHTPAE
jgi:tRNA/rRNA methyltransferase